LRIKENDDFETSFLSPYALPNIFIEKENKSPEMERK